MSEHRTSNQMADSAWVKLEILKCALGIKSLDDGELFKRLENFWAFAFERGSQGYDEHLLGAEAEIERLTKALDAYQHTALDYWGRIEEAQKCLKTAFGGQTDEGPADETSDNYARTCEVFVQCGWGHFGCLREKGHPGTCHFALKQDALPAENGEVSL